MTLKNKNAKQNHMNRLINILKIISCILYQHSWYYRYYVDMKADKMEFKKIIIGNRLLTKWNELYYNV